MKCKPNMSSRR